MQATHAPAAKGSSSSDKISACLPRMSAFHRGCAKTWFRTRRKERHAIRAVVFAGAPAGVAPKPSILGGLTQERRRSFSKFVTFLRFHTACTLPCASPDRGGYRARRPKAEVGCLQRRYGLDLNQEVLPIELGHFDQCDGGGCGRRRCSKEPVAALAVLS